MLESGPQGHVLKSRDVLGSPKGGDWKHNLESRPNEKVSRFNMPTGHRGELQKFSGRIWNAWWRALPTEVRRILKQAAFDFEVDK